MQKQCKRFKRHMNNFFKTMAEYFYIRAHKTDGAKNSSQ